MDELPSILTIIPSPKSHSDLSNDAFPGIVLFSKITEEPKPEPYIHPSAPLIQKIKKEREDDTTITYY